MASVRTQKEIRQRAPIWLVTLLVANLVIMAVDARDADGRQKMLRSLDANFRVAATKRIVKGQRRHFRIFPANLEFPQHCPGKRATKRTPDAG